MSQIVLKGDRVNSSRQETKEIRVVGNDRRLLVRLVICGFGEGLQNDNDFHQSGCDLDRQGELELAIVFNFDNLPNGLHGCQVWNNLYSLV